MKNKTKNISVYLSCLILLVFISTRLNAQDPAELSTESTETKIKPVKNTFESAVLLDNQTVIVPIKGTFEMDIQHRFGTINNGAKDLFGLFAPSNIRIALSYVPIKNLLVGAGITKDRMQTDIHLKYALIKQTPTKFPVSISYFGNMVIDGRDGSYFRYNVHRFSYFNQLIIARKITEKLSIQVAPSLSWFNNIEGYVNSNGDIKNKMKNEHIAISTMIRYKLSESTALNFGYDQALTAHPTNNPHPNLCFGFEKTTSAHNFQIFAGNYYGIVPQSNNLFNQNDYMKSQYVLGFNISRLWNY